MYAIVSKETGEVAMSGDSFAVYNEDKESGRIELPMCFYTKKDAEKALAFLFTKDNNFHTDECEIKQQIE